MPTSLPSLPAPLPAMIEAFYQGRPLMALTADRPERFRGTGAPQAISQPGIFGEHAGSGPLADWQQRSPWHWNVELEEDFTPGEWTPPELADPPAIRLPVETVSISSGFGLRADPFGKPTPPPTAGSAASTNATMREAEVFTPIDSAITMPPLSARIARPSRESSRLLVVMSLPLE